MAFYTSRVDDSGRELERRPSGRSMSTSLSDSMSRLDLSSNSSSHNIKIVNSAAYIERNVEIGEASSVSDEKEEAISEWQSDIVPPLDLQSEENYPTPRDFTFSYRNQCDVAKLVLKPDNAYETWLSAKKKLLSDEAIRRKKAEEQKRAEYEERRRISKEKLKSWMEDKAKQSKSREKIKPVRSMNEKPSKPQVSKEEAQAKFEKWERVKRLEEERRRLLVKQEQQQRREMEDLRRQQAAKAWEEWVAEAAKKPKPVPLNRGIFTLRGTISNIYVNPNEWDASTENPNEDN